MKAGFVNIFGRPNAGKSTLMNALVGEKLAIVTPKQQTTRHRIKGILNTEDYQIIFSDTPGIIEPKYKLHERMMASMRSGIEDADVALYMMDIHAAVEKEWELFSSLSIAAPVIWVLNKIDTAKDAQISAATAFLQKKEMLHIIPVSAKREAGMDKLLAAILNLLPEGEPFYAGEDLSDLPMKFFIGEIIREKVFLLYQEEVPYQATVLVQEYSEKISLIKIRADIIVQRESQKAIILGHKGSMIRKLGTMAREEIEKFIGGKVFLELFVKVRPKWRDNDLFLKEYGYS